MANFRLVDPQTVEQHNEYYEIRISPPGEEPYSVFFTTDEENLEETAAQVVSDQAQPGEWIVIPHRKKHGEA